MGAGVSLGAHLAWLLPLAPPPPLPRPSFLPLEVRSPGPLWVLISLGPRHAQVFVVKGRSLYFVSTMSMLAFVLTFCILM